MKIERITLRQIQMPLVHFFETSFSRTYKRDIILVQVQSEGLTGWGEVSWTGLSARRRVGRRGISSTGKSLGPQLRTSSWQS